MGKHKKLLLKDGRYIVFLNTCGENAEDVPEELVSFLKFVHADLKESQTDFQDDYEDKCRNQSPISRGAEKWRRDLCFWNY